MILRGQIAFRGNLLIEANANETGLAEKAENKNVEREK
jgi:hypothetical protein